jgi:hypothetical protein
MVKVSQMVNCLQKLLIYLHVLLLLFYYPDGGHFRIETCRNGQRDVSNINI